MDSDGTIMGGLSWNNSLFGGLDWDSIMRNKQCGLKIQFKSFIVGGLGDHMVGEDNIIMFSEEELGGERDVHGESFPDRVRMRFPLT